MMSIAEASPAPVRQGEGRATGNPRPVITGVTLTSTPVCTPSERLSDSPEFDWYAATLAPAPDSPALLLADAFNAKPIDADGDVLPREDPVRLLADGLGAEVRAGKALHGYRLGFDLVRPEGVAARVLMGGDNGEPHAWASGADAAGFAALVRSLWPDDHRVTRLDSRIDFGGQGDGEEVWEALVAICVNIATEKGLRTSLAGDYIGKEHGRTLYIGSKSSAVYVRLYEKGKQLRGMVKDDERRDAIPLDWCRLELQARPQKQARYTAAQVSAEEAWGMSPWVQRLAHEAAVLDVPRVHLNQTRETDDERALAHLAHQYGNTITRMAGRIGWDAVWDRLRSQITEA